MCIVASSLRILTKFRRRNSTRKLGESTHAAMNRQVAVVDDVKVTDWIHESIIMAATSPLVVVFVFLAWQRVLSLYYERWLLLGHSTANHGVFNISSRSCVILGSSNS